jgi:hypothetical protein
METLRSFSEPPCSDSSCRLCIAPPDPIRASPSPENRLPNVGPESFTKGRGDGSQQTTGRGRRVSIGFSVPSVAFCRKQPVPSLPLRASVKQIPTLRFLRVLRAFVVKSPWSIPATHATGLLRRAYGAQGASRLHWLLGSLRFLL